MAAGKWKLYENAKKYIGDGTHDLDDTTNWKLALFLSTSNANTLSNSVYGDLTNEHANANGYVTGGVAMTGISWTQTGGTATYDTTDVVFNASGGSIVCRFGVVYRNATVNSIVKPLLCVSLLDTTPADVTTTTGNSFTIQMNASGLFAGSGANTD